MTIKTKLFPLGYIKPVQSGEKQPPAGNGANANTTFTITLNTSMLNIAFQNISPTKYAFIGFVNDSSQDIKHICEFHDGDPTDTAKIIPQWLDDTTYLWGGTYSTSSITLNLETTDTTLWGTSANLGAFLCEEDAQGYGTRINLGWGTFTHNPPTGNGANANATYSHSFTVDNMNMYMSNVTASQYLFIGFSTTLNPKVHKIVEFHNGQNLNNRAITPGWITDKIYLWDGTYNRPSITLNLEITDPSLIGTKARLNMYFCDEGSDKPGMSMGEAEEQFKAKN